MERLLLDFVRVELVLAALLVRVYVSGRFHSHQTRPLLHQVQPEVVWRANYPLWSLHCLSVPFQDGIEDVARGWGHGGRTHRSQHCVQFDLAGHLARVQSSQDSHELLQGAQFVQAERHGTVQGCQRR